MATKTRIERFDEAYKMLLIVMSIILAGSFEFFKEIMEPRFFQESTLLFVLAVFIWAFSTLGDGLDEMIGGGLFDAEQAEYVAKTFGWWMLMLSLGTILLRLYSAPALAGPPLFFTAIILIGLGLTLPIFAYLKEVINEEIYSVFVKINLVMTLLIIVVDILYFLGFISFPL